jgi:hypothetical protein
VTPRTRKLYSFWIDPTQAEGLKALKTRDGVPESESLRRAIDAWLKEKGVSVEKKPERKRAVTHKRS